MAQSADRPSRLTAFAAEPARPVEPAPPSDVALSVGILLWPSFPLLSLAGIVESLRHAGDHGDDSNPRYSRWEILGPAGTTARSSCGISVAPTAGYLHPGRFDHVFVIGGLLREMEKAPQSHRDYLHAVHRAKTPLTGVCTGSFVLAREGLLDGRVACVHPYHQPHFEAAFPGHRFVTNRDYDIGGNVGTVLGGVSILPLMKRIVGNHMGPDRAAKVVHQMTLPAPDGPGGLTLTEPTQARGIEDPRIQRALVILDAEAVRNPSISGLARTLGLSERHFLRLFRSHLGCTPQDYLLGVKLRAAVWMLRHTARSVTAIAYASGFASGANLADHCRKRLGASPSAIRRAAQTAS